MKTLSASPKPLRALMVVLGCASLMTGCLLDSKTEIKADVTAETGAWITGQIQGDAQTEGSAKAAASGWEGALVTTHEVSASGAVGPAVDAAHAEASGEFRVRTSLRGERALIVKIVREGKEWKARVEDRFEDGKTRVVGVVDLATTVEAEVWVQLRGTAEGHAALASEIRAAVEAEGEAGRLAEFRGNAAARAQLMTRLTAAVIASAKARGEAVADLVARVEAEAEADPGSDTVVRPRPVLTPCERAAIRLAAMDPNDSAYAVLRARFAAHCLDQDTIPPSRPTCEELTARLEGMDPESPAYERLRLRVAIHCDMIPPPPPLTPCERAAIRIAAMDPDHPDYATLRARFAAHCLEGDPDAGEGDSGADAPPSPKPEGEDSFVRATVEADVKLEVSVDAGSGARADAAAEVNSSVTAAAGR